MTNINININALSYAYGQPACSGRIRTVPEDFIVNEIPGFEPDGEGEHVLLHIQKRNTNTDWLAKKISQFVGLRQVDVSYAGMKDRNAVTTQWFSVRLAGKPEPDWMALNSDEITVLQHHRHSRKLRKGALKGNRFKIVVRDIDGDVSDLETRLQTIKEQGIPNYFGEQRFGIDGANITEAKTMFSGKRVKSHHQRSLYLSAARSYIFNDHLSLRVGMASWNKAINGDVMLLSGTNSYFVAEIADDEINRRIDTFDIHPSGVMWGRGRSPAMGESADMENALKEKHADFCEGLEKAGLDQSRRAMRLIVNDLGWKMDADNKVLELEFELPAGSYATSVLREIVIANV